MRRSLSFLSIFIVNCLIVSCSSNPSSPQLATNMINRQQIVASTKQKYPPKNPQNVALFTNKVPSKAYKIIGVASVSKYNLLGVPREDATVDRMMKNLAASIGGDALINVSSNGRTKQGKIIAFQKILI